MSFIITLARGISVELFATLAGTSIVAISIVAGIMSKKETKKSIYKAINGYLGMGYFVSSLTIFVLGVVLTLILDSFEANLKKKFSYSRALMLALEEWYYLQESCFFLEE